MTLPGFQADQIVCFSLSSLTMTSSILIQPVVLSGGSGTRLWPLSREKYPKQLLSLIGQDSLLQATVRRVLGTPGVTLAAPMVVCNEEYRYVIAEQLRLRFGATQPQFVAAVLSAGQAPVTIDALKTELRGLAPVLLTGNRDDSTWATVKRELSELFVLRKENGPSLAPNERLIRAEALVDAGKLDLAVEEVAALPGASIAQSWMARAKRFSDARKALDRLEQVAILRPVAVPVIVAPPVETVPSDVPVPTP